MIGPASSVQRGCLSKEESTAACDGDQSKSTITCCHSDRCNGRIQSGKLHLTRRLMQMETDGKPSLIPHPESNIHAAPLILVLIRELSVS